MHLKNVSSDLHTSIHTTLEKKSTDWLNEKLTTIIEEKSKRSLYLTYSMIAAKVQPIRPNLDQISNMELMHYLVVQEVNIQQLVRVYLFVRVLEVDSDFFSPLVATIIEVADTSELETFFKFLPLLPNAAYYRSTAVDALRTNIETIFDAIALKNPYPSTYFSTSEWNQMYLKAAFMQRDLTEIKNIDTMANADLARIISDYAHERWEASRTVMPYFWRPVSKFIDAALLQDMKRLFASSNQEEQRAAALCCYTADHPEANKLVQAYPTLVKEIQNNQLKWETITQ